MDYVTGGIFGFIFGLVIKEVIKTPFSVLVALFKSHFKNANNIKAENRIERGRKKAETDDALKKCLHLMDDVTTAAYAFQGAAANGPNPFSAIKFQDLVNKSNELFEFNRKNDYLYPDDFKIHAIKCVALSHGLANNADHGVPYNGLVSEVHESYHEFSELMKKSHRETK